MKPSPDSPPLEIYLLGLVDFQEVLSLQRRIVYEVGDGGGAALVALRAPANDQRGPSPAAGPTSSPTTRRFAPWESTFTGSIGVEAACFIFPVSSRPTWPYRCKAMV